MKNYLLRLDDASEYMDVERWLRMEQLLDIYKIKPIFGIIPRNEDEMLVSEYAQNPDFWKLMHVWIEKGWTPAMHGYEHRYVTTDGGINPVNMRSEFAGLSYEEQAQKIRKGYQILVANNIKPDIFFAPSHTFDTLTLKALYDETPIRRISDTIANDIYKEGDFWFIPQQSGVVRVLPFKTVTFCYHPNTMKDEAFLKLENFLQLYGKHFVQVDQLDFGERKRGLLDHILRKIYFGIR